MAFLSSVWRGQLAVKMLLESVGLWCWGVSFWFLIFIVGWVVGGVRAPFVMNSWILFSCTGFFRSFLVIPDGFEPLWSGSPLRHVSITNEDKQMLLPRQRFNRLKGNVNRHCIFLTVSQFNRSFSSSFLIFFFFWSSMPSTRVKHKLIMTMIIMMFNVNDSKRVLIILLAVMRWSYSNHQSNSNINNNDSNNNDNHNNNNKNKSSNYYK